MVASAWPELPGAAPPVTLAAGKVLKRVIRFRGTGVFQLGDRRQRHHAAVGRTHVNLFDVVGTGTVFRGRLHDHLPHLAVQVELADVQQPNSACRVPNTLPTGTPRVRACSRSSETYNCCEAALRVMVKPRNSGRWLALATKSLVTCANCLMSPLPRL